MNLLRTKIHALTYQPTQDEHFQNPLMLGKKIVKDIHQMFMTCSKGKRTVEGYKGGHVEKDLLQRLKIPSLLLLSLVWVLF